MYISQCFSLAGRQHTKRRDQCWRGSTGLFCVVTSDPRGGMEQCQGRFRLVRKRFYDLKIISSAVNLNCVWNCANIQKNVIKHNFVPLKYSLLILKKLQRLTWNLDQKICIKNVLYFPIEIYKWKYSLERKKTDPLLRLYKISAELSSIFIFREMEDLQHLISSSPVTKILLI